MDVNNKQLAGSGPQSCEDWLRDNQVVLVLTGLIASGKSTFSTALEAHLPSFRRCNQDELKYRRAVENAARDYLQQGFSVCIDRTNVDEGQRTHWITIAKEFPNVTLWSLVFDIPLNVCSERLRTRVDHPTIKSVEQGQFVLDRFSSDYKEPSFREGFDRIFHLKATDHSSPQYTKAEILDILGNIRDSLPPPHKNPAALTTIDKYFSPAYSGSPSGVNKRVTSPRQRASPSSRVPWRGQTRGSPRRRGFSGATDSGTGFQDPFPHGNSSPRRHFGAATVSSWRERKVDGAASQPPTTREHPHSPTPRPAAMVRVT